MSKYVYGIDLGTTYSCIAYQDEHGRPVVVKNTDGDNITPSVVQFEEDGTPIVGKQAKEQSVLDPDNTISLVKTLMGKTDYAYTARDGRDMSPAEISAFILKKVANDAGKLNDDTVTDVVITCPAYFGEVERTATKQAGELAGLNVLSIIEEPTAAAISYGFNRGAEDKTILVYDLGGGTFDITVMKISDGEIRVICTDGNHDLGGKNWDDELIRHCKDAFVEETNYDDEFDNESLQEFALGAEDIKIRLSTKESVKKPFNIQGVRANIEVTRDKFDELTSSLLSSTISLTRKVIDEAKAEGVTSIDEILLVGGSTRMPQVSKAIQENFEMEAKIVDPDEAVAKGAATYAVMIREGSIPSVINDDPNKEVKERIVDDETGEEELTVVDKVTGEEETIKVKPTLSGKPPGGDIKVISASTKSFGIKAILGDKGERIYNMIIKDNELPIDITEDFYTNEDNQTSVEMALYESTRKEKDYEVIDDFKVVEAILPIPPNTPKGAPIAVTMVLTEDGTLRVKGVFKQTGDVCEAEFKSDCILTKEALEEAREHVAALTKMMD